MKTKNKTLALVEIAVVLCLLFLVASPAIAAEQTTQKVSASGVTTASEADYVLGIYGNANEDDTIDMRDVTYTKLVIFGKKPETELADAYYDDEVDVLDVVQIKLIILGRESELTLVDTADRIVTVSKPVERIVILCPDEYQALRVLRADDKIVGITVETERDWDWLIGEEIASVGNRYNPDPEAILVVEPDLVLGEGWTIETKLEGKIPEDIPMVALGFTAIEILDEELPKLGYILSNQDTVEDYFSNFRDKYVDIVEARTEDLSDEERLGMYVGWGTLGYGGYSSIYGGSALGVQYTIETAGGKNVFEDMPLMHEVDREELITREPDMAFYGLRYPDAGYAVDDVSNAKAIREDIMDELVGVKAVENGNIYMEYSRIWWYGTCHPIGLCYLAKILHPDLFEDLDPNEIHREYLRDWLRTDYDLDGHGIFVYHPEQHPDGR